MTLHDDEGVEDFYPVLITEDEADKIRSLCAHAEDPIEIELAIRRILGEEVYVETTYHENVQLHEVMLPDLLGPKGEMLCLRSI